MATHGGYRGPYPEPKAHITLRLPADLLAQVDGCEGKRGPTIETLLREALAARQVNDEPVTIPHRLLRALANPALLTVDE